MRAVGILFLVCITLWLIGDPLARDVVDRDLNRVDMTGRVAGAEAKALHDSLFIADLHSDMLLWDRDPRARQAVGQTDLAKLREGGVDLQVFSTVTATPRGQNFGSNTLEGGDNITLLALVQGWPVATWASIRARAVHQAERLHALERQGHLTIVRTASDLDAPGLKGVLLTEGAHPLEGEVGNVAHLFDAGYRVMGLQHFFDNALGGSLHGAAKGGLTPFGRKAVAEMGRLGMIIDLAHSSEAVVDDVLDMATRPVMVSHTGLRAACPGTESRNMSDARLKRIADGGGLIGIGFFNGAICDTSPRGIADTIRVAVDVLGEDAVALGSDFDGAVATAITAAELALVTDALLEAGLDEGVIRKVMGENAERFFRQNLPVSPSFSPREKVSRSDG